MFEKKMYTMILMGDTIKALMLIDATIRAWFYLATIAFGFPLLLQRCPLIWQPMKTDDRPPHNYISPFGSWLAQYKKIGLNFLTRPFFIW